MTRLLHEIQADQRAWDAATHEVIEAARAVAHREDHQRLSKEDTQLIIAIVAMEALEQAAAERFKAERQQQEKA
jgi:hypothetical protein